MIILFLCYDAQDCFAPCLTQAETIIRKKPLSKERRMVLMTPASEGARMTIRAKNMHRFIMAQDGGGARGAITTFFNAALEAKLGAPLWQSCDLISGISTGSISGACYAVGISAATVNDWYADQAKYWKWSKLPPFPIAPMYKKDVMKDAIAELVGKHTVMGECKTKLMIGTVDLCTDDNIYFRSWKPEHKEIRVVDVVERSFSAAVYFGATPVKVEQRVYADGGEGDGNCPLMESMITAYNLGWRDEGFFILSLGTGEINGTQTYKEAAGWSPTIGQTKEYLGLARRQAVRTQIKYAQTVRSFNDCFDFARINIEIPEALDELNGYEHAKEYQELGRRLACIYLDNGGFDNIPRQISANKKNFNRLDWLRTQLQKTAMKADSLTRQITEFKNLQSKGAL